MEKSGPSIGEPFATPSVYDVLKELPARHPEAAYRRGYADGWAGAIDAMRKLMLQDGLSSRAAYDACWSHWRSALFEWYDRSSRDPRSQNVGAAYRRGYRDGWAEGTDGIWNLIFANGMRREASYDACREHWQNELCEWAQGDYTQMVLPPALERKET